MSNPPIESLKRIGTGLAFIIWPFMALLAVGFLLLGTGLYVAKAIPRWQSGALILSMLVTAVSSALDIDIIGIVATIILALALVPLGVRIMAGSKSPARSLVWSSNST